MLSLEGLKGARKGLVSQAQEVDLYTEGSGEPWKGFQEGRDIPGTAKGMSMVG